MTTTLRHWRVRNRIHVTTLIKALEGVVEEDELLSLDVMGFGTERVIAATIKALSKLAGKPLSRSDIEAKVVDEVFAMFYVVMVGAVDGCEYFGRDQATALQVLHLVLRDGRPCGFIARRVRVYPPDPLLVESEPEENGHKPPC